MKGKGILAAGLLASLGIDLTITEVRAADPPSWAFPINPPGLSPAPDDGVPRHVPESDAAFTLTQVRDLFFHRTGIRTIIRRCPASLGMAESPT